MGAPAPHPHLEHHSRCLASQLRQAKLSVSVFVPRDLVQSCGVEAQRNVQNTQDKDEKQRRNMSPTHWGAGGLAATWTLNMETFQTVRREIIVRP